VEDEDSTLECGTLEVPLVPGETDGEMIDMAVIRMPSTGTEFERIGSLVINPGGPGGSGVDTVVGMSEDFPTELSDRFDLVGFDPRGVGYSTEFRCEIDDDALDGADEDASFDAYLNYAQASYDACVDQNPELVKHMSTVDVANDLDLLRESLGDDKLNYLGFSYGTQIGSVYATLFPDKARALVLDSSVMPNPDPIQEMEEQGAGFQLAFDRFVDACAESDSCPMGSDPRAEVDAILASFDDGPLTYTQVDGTEVEMDESDFIGAVSGSLYNTDNWGTLALALSDFTDGGAELLVGTAESEEQPIDDDPIDVEDLEAESDDDGDPDERDDYDNSTDVLVAVNCSDATRRLDAAEVSEVADKLVADQPLFGLSSAQQIGSCSVWPAPAEPVPTVTGKGAPPILVVANVGDPATPYPWAQRMADTFEGARLLTYEGDGHIAFQRGGACVDDAIVDYLVNLELPAEGTSCPIQDSERGFDTQVDGFLASVAEDGADVEQLQCLYDEMTTAVTPVQLEMLFVSEDDEGIAEVYQTAASPCGID
ncbi:MAG: alpha/beta hydrolase, partial [Microthrixaceae bacterium]